MQVAFFKLTNLLPEKRAINLIKKSIEKKFASKGKKIVEINKKCVDQSISQIIKVNILNESQPGSNFEISSEISLNLSVGIVADIPTEGVKTLQKKTVQMSIMEPTLEINGIIEGKQYGVISEDTAEKLGYAII